MTGRVRGLRLQLSVACVAIAVPIFAVGAGAAGVRKSLFMSLEDDKGAPITGVTVAAEDVAIREDNQDRKIISVQPATSPIAVAFLIDTAMDTRVKDAYGTPDEWIRDMRLATASFAKQVLDRSPDASIELMEFGQAALVVVPFTSSPDEYAKGVNHLVSKPGAASVLLEALDQANKDLEKRPTKRRAIVTLNIEPSNEQSQMNEQGLQDAFRRSTAQLWSLSIQRGALKAASRDIMLQRITKATGGMRDLIVGISAAPDILRRFANALVSQYEVVYERPEGKTPKSLQIGTRVNGVKIHASAYPPE